MGSNVHIDVDVDEDDEVVHVALSGELDIVTCPPIAAVLGTLPLDGRCVEIDLAGLEFIDSMGIGELCRFRNARPRAKVVLLNPQHPVQKVIDLTGIGEAFVIERRALDHDTDLS